MDWPTDFNPQEVSLEIHPKTDLAEPVWRMTVERLRLKTGIRACP